MVEIISVRFKSGGKPYYFNPNGIPFNVGDGVIVETSRGTEYGTCIEANSQIDEMELIAPLRPVVRKADDQDKEILARNQEKETEAFLVGKRKIREHKLDMKLVSADYNFEGNKILFLFTADGRVDFRSLVKDLAGTLKARIELRQIGVRDESKLLGGLGICGRPFCCSQFLNEFQPVSIKMAKVQNLSLNPAKISGTCGRLMCCLKYEQEAYEDLVKTAPKLESFVETPDGAGTVTGINLLRQTAQVRLDSAPESAHTYHNSELSIVRSGKGRRPEGYVEPPLEELARLRRPVEEEEELPESEGEEYAEPWDEPQEEPDAKEGGRRNSRRRRGSGRSGEKRQKQEKQPQAQAEKAQQKPKRQAKPAGEGKPAGQPKATGEGKPAGQPKATGEGKPAGQPKAAGEGKPAGQPKVSGEGKPAAQPKPAGEGKPSGDGAEGEKDPRRAAHRRRRPRAGGGGGKPAEPKPQ